MGYEEHNTGGLKFRIITDDAGVRHAEVIDGKHLKGALAIPESIWKGLLGERDK